MVLQRSLRYDRPRHRGHKALRFNMADEEDLSALGNAFQGLHPVLVQQEQIYREAGRAVINFSNIESDLTFLFGVLIGADLYSMAIAAIGDVKNNFALRL